MGHLRSLIARRAVRSYDDKAVPVSVVKELIEQARWAGSARNRQPWRVVAVYDPATRARLSQLGTYAAHIATAPVALVLLSPVERMLDTEFDVGRFAQSLTIAASAAELGSCVVSLYPEDNSRRAAALVGADDEWSARHAITLGYSAPSAQLASAGRRAVPSGRRSVDELLTIH